MLTGSQAIANAILSKRDEEARQLGLALLREQVQSAQEQGEARRNVPAYSEAYYPAVYGTPGISLTKAPEGALTRGLEGNPDMMAQILAANQGLEREFGRPLTPEERATTVRSFGGMPSGAAEGALTSNLTGNLPPIPFRPTGPSPAEAARLVQGTPGITTMGELAKNPEAMRALVGLQRAGVSVKTPEEIARQRRDDERLQRANRLFQESLADADRITERLQAGQPVTDRELVGAYVKYDQARIDAGHMPEKPAVFKFLEDKTEYQKVARDARKALPVMRKMFEGDHDALTRFIEEIAPTLESKSFRSSVEKEIQEILQSGKLNAAYLRFMELKNQFPGRDDEELWNQVGLEKPALVNAVEMTGKIPWKVKIGRESYAAGRKTLEEEQAKRKAKTPEERELERQNIGFSCERINAPC
jgi:hypothetical protein